MIREFITLDSELNIIDKTTDAYGKNEYIFPASFDYTTVLNTHKSSVE